MAYDEEEEVACPVCGKKVGLEVPSCPYCGAEFEEDEAAEEAEVKVVAPESEEDVACPVCGSLVGFDVASCTKCGAEFEEEEIEEVIEVEERSVYAPAQPAPAKARPAEKPKARAKPKARPRRGAPVPELNAASIMDLRVVGLALAVLGVIGMHVAIWIDWYWSWVPPIADNMALFVVLPIVVLFVGLLVFMLVRKALSAGKKVPRMMPNTSLSLFLFGILALIVVLLWSPINSALQDSQWAVAAVFIVALVVGIVLMFMGTRSSSARSYA